MKRKKLYLISIFVILAFLLTGCGNSDTGSSLSSNLNIAAANYDGVIEVDYGTSLSNVLNNELPQKTNVKLSSGEKVEIPVDWNEDDDYPYNSEQAGEYKFFGFLNLSGLDYKNPDNISLDSDVAVNEPEMGSKYRPAQIDDKVSSLFNSDDYGDVILTLEITEIISGDQALEMIIEDIDNNKFYLPDLEEEYVLVKYNIILESVENKALSFSLSPDAFDAVSKNDVVYDNLLTNNELYEALVVGRAASGYAAYSADIATEPFAVFYRLDGGEIWFDISKSE